jgi:hypothetical protein
VDVTTLPHVSVLADADSVLAGSVGGVSQKITVAELRSQLDPVHAAPVVTTVVDADGFAIADSADSFKVKRFSWSSLKAHILAWFGPVTATLTNKTLGAGTVYQNPAGSVGFTVAGHAGDSGHLQFATGLENGNVQIRTGGVNNCDIVLFPSGGTAGLPLAPGGRVTVNAAKTGQDAILLANGVDPNVDWNFVTKGPAGQVKANGIPVVVTTGAQSLSNKTLVTPTITGPTITPVTAAPNALALTVGSAQVRANGYNVAFGGSAQQSLTTGNYNVAFGTSAQQSLTTGGNNVAFGTGAQKALTTGGTNVAFGTSAQQSLTEGSNNVALGYGAQYSPGGAAYPTTTALNQTSVGHQSGQNTATQIDGITTIGYRATAGAVNGTSLGLSSRADHTNSVALGSNSVTTAANQVAVGPRDIEITDATKGVVLKSPDGKRWRVTVNNAGALSAAAV